MVLVLFLAVVATSLLGFSAVQRWKVGVISANESLTLLAAHQLAATCELYFTAPATRPGRTPCDMSEASAEALDQQLTRLTHEVFSQSQGVKGGFWLLKRQRFMGYAFPTSPPPRPVFGPPPRSYAIILDQINESIDLGEPVARLHEFDPAIFPLVTVPVWCGDEIVAVAWARIHIERELPALRMRRYLNVVALAAFSAFLVALLITLHQRREIHSLSRNLKIIAEDPAFRLTGRRGMLGSIREAINGMVDALEDENRRRHALEEELHQRDKMAALGKLLSGVAHEVKTPLAIVKTRVQIWQRDLAAFTRSTGTPSPLAEDSMTMVLREIDRLTNLLHKLLFFSRPVFRDRMSPLDIDDLIRHSMRTIRPKLRQKSVAMELDLAASEGSVHGDADSLHQVFLNLMSNSLAAVDDNGQIIISSRIDADAGLIHIELRDTGPGLPREIREKAFDPFFTTRHGGAGLGLSIAYEIVRAHDGEIGFVAPDSRGGAHCVINLPLAQPHEAESP